tara:strand:- start:1801 stop:2115 length:315 start_codon:yes stop_codon:yes gene_type:complete
MVVTQNKSGGRGEIDEEGLTKGQLRKLYALRKSLGDGIANRAFSEWLKQELSARDNIMPVDKNAETIVAALQKLIEKNQLSIPRGGYLVRRGRGRVIVERARKN